MAEAAGAPREVVEAEVLLGRYYVPSRYPNAWPSGSPSKRLAKEDAERPSARRGRSWSMSEGLSRLKALNPFLDVADLEKVVSMHRGAASVVVYGSAARGRFVRGLSDIDVLVVTESPPGRGLTLRGSSGDIDIVYMTPEEFCQALAGGNLIAREAAEEGQVIAGRSPASLCGREA